MEIWKDIKDYEGYYQVSNLGRIKSLKRETNNQFGKENIFLKKILQNDGYYGVNLTKNGIRKRLRVHRLVASTFLGENTNNLLQVNHKNGNKLDNRVENLEWCTPKENTQHSIKMGLTKIKKVKYIDPKTKKEILFNSVKEASKVLNINDDTIYGNIKYAKKKKFYYIGGVNDDKTRSG